MKLVLHLDGASPEPHIEAIVVSPVRLYCDCLIAIFAHDPIVHLREGYTTVERALAGAARSRPGMVLLDAAFPNGTAVATQLGTALPGTLIVAFAVPETEETVLDWAGAGIAGYVPNTTSLSELPALLRRIRSGEQFCSSRVTSALLHQVAVRTNAHKPDCDAQASLTRRERDILGLVAAGLTNKEIARHLNIGIGTTKTHVHNILVKLQLSNRVQMAVQSF